jgi:hypothetical protein
MIKDKMATKLIFQILIGFICNFRIEWHSQAKMVHSLLIYHMSRLYLYLEKRKLHVENGSEV